MPRDSLFSSDRSLASEFATPLGAEGPAAARKFATRRVVRNVSLLAILGPLQLVACSSVGGVSIATGLQTYAPSGKPVKVYTRGDKPAGVEIGLVEVHGAADEAVIDELFPVFLKRAAALGADAVLLEDVHSEARVVTSFQYDRLTYNCPYRGVCTATQTYPISNEVNYLSLRGRAYRTDAAPEAHSTTPSPPPVPPSIDSVRSWDAGSAEGGP